MSFGSSDPEPRQTTQTTTQLLSPEQSAIIKPLVPIISEFGQTPLEQFGKSTIPGFNPTELLAQSTALTQAGQTGVDVATANAFANFLQSPAALTPGTNPALQANIDAAVRPLNESFANTILPNIRGGEVVAGQVGGSRGRLAEQEATNQLLRQISETSSGIVGENFANVIKAGTQSLFAQPSLAQSSLLPAQTIAGVGQAERGLTTSLLQEEAQRFGAEQLLAFAPAQAAVNVAFGIPGGTTTSTGTVIGGSTGPGLFQSALGGASLGASIGGPTGAGLGALAGLLFGDF